MKWLLLTVCCVCFIELFLRLRTKELLQRIRALTAKVARVLRSSSISDHWKEKVLPRYAGRLLTHSLHLLLILLAAFSPFLIASLIAEYYGMTFSAMLVSWQGMVTATLIAIGYSILRSRFD